MAGGISSRRLFFRPFAIFHLHPWEASESDSHQRGSASIFLKSYQLFGFNCRLVLLYSYKSEVEGA
jgi:hypothetical protein